MRRLTSLCAVLAVFGFAGEAGAQQTTADTQTEELRRMVTETTPADRDRSTVRSFLQREDVGEAAAAHGIDLRRLEDGVNTLSADDARDLAERVEDTRNQLDQVGGDTFVISSTVVIIGLLIIILVIVA